MAMIQKWSTKIAAGRQPVILLGMHRSGTTMIAELLGELGLFQGSELNEHYESTYFLEINDAILARSGGAWDHPAAVNHLAANDPAAEMAAVCLKADLLSPAIKGFHKKGGVETYAQPWGWKDPRTDFTLPLWLRLFPEAKLIRIVRNGVDVAASLRKRELDRLARARERFDKKFADAPASGHFEKASFKGSVRCLSLAGAFTLWEEYVAQEEALLPTLKNAQQSFTFEDFTRDPTAHLQRLVKFCGLDGAESKITSAAAKVKPARANAYAADPELKAFHEQVRGSPWMQKFGYGK